MYSAIINSPPTTLSGSITNVDTTINVVDGSRLPVAPNLATIGGEDNAETILYATRTGNTLSGITRGFQGTAQAWGIGTPVARMFTAYDYDTLRNHMATANSHVASTSNPHSVTTGQIGAAAASHAHGNITNAGAIGSTANLPVITGASGVLAAGTFGSAANTFCQGNDTRLSDARTPVAHNQDMSTITTGTLLTNRLLEPTDVRANISMTARPLFDVLRADRTAFLPSDQIIIESSTDGGSTWVDAAVSLVNKRRLFTGQRPAIAIPVIGGIKNTNCMMRVTITAMRYNVPIDTPETQRYNFWNSANVLSTERYCTFSEGWIWLTAGADHIHCRVEHAHGNNSNAWVLERESFMAGWSGGNYVRLSGNVFGGGTSQIAQPWNWRFTFRTATTANNFDNAQLNATWAAGSQVIHHIKLSGINSWSHSNNLAFHDRLYSFDENQNATFPATLSATQLLEGANRVYSVNNNNIGVGATQYSAGNHAHDIGSGTSGTLAVPRGGTGAITFTSGDVLVGAGTGAIATLSRSGIDSRTTFPPTAHNHAATEITSGTLTVAQGGTGATTHTTGNVLIGNAAAAVTSLSRSGIDSRASFPPDSHVHGAITNAGAIGSAANLPIITGASGVLVASSFGTIANTFCQGNDTRLSDARTPVAHNQDASTITTGTLAVARGGTGIASYTTNNYIRAQSATVLEQRTPAQVLADISAAPATHSHVIRYNQLA